MGHTWLWKHNPDINWVTRDVKMSHCSGRCCLGCRDEIRKERRGRKIQACRIADCSEGEIPDLDRDDEDDEDVDAEIEDGDRIFATGLHPPPEEIRAASTISQRLVEAFKRNRDSPDAKKNTPVLAEDILAHLKEFSAVFSKESFDVLPSPKPWDHAIELIPGGAPLGCKVYPLSPSEQKELDAFLKENLETGRI